MGAFDRSTDVHIQSLNSLRFHDVFHAPSPGVEELGVAGYLKELEPDDGELAVARKATVARACFTLNIDLAGDKAVLTNMLEYGACASFRHGPVAIGSRLIGMEYLSCLKKASNRVGDRVGEGSHPWVESALVEPT